MSNRYVWQRFNYSTERQQGEQTIRVNLGRVQIAYIYITENASNVSPPASASSWPANAELTDYDEVLKVYGVFDDTIPHANYFSLGTDEYGPDSTYGVYYTRYNIEANLNGNYIVFGQLYPTKVIYQAIKGAASGATSNASQRTYPQDGVSGNYWYTYQGSDNIDAAAVTYSSQEPRGGQPITINVSPSTGNEYGGTVRYTYQVQLAGGAWTTVATNSTATSQQYTIPAGTASFAARVLASDTWGFSSSDYTTGATLTVINNEPPSAPDGITIGPVLGGEQTTITWGEATDTDGTIASYQLERQIDNGDTWEQIYTGLTRSYDDTINSEWATVNYRVRAVDDDGEAGPYTTGTMQTVNAGWLYFSGPPEDMGDKPAPFAFSFAIGSTTSNVTDIDVTVTYDDTVIYTGTPDADEQINILIDTRITYAGEHVLLIEAEKANLLGLSRVCTFEVPELSLPDGGRIILYHDDNGVPVYPMTLGRAVISLGSEDANRIFDRYFSGTYTGTGTSGAGNPCRLRLSFVPRFLFVFSPNGNAWGFWIRTAEPTSAAQGTMATNGGSCTVQWNNDDLILSWYGSSAGVQLNASGVEYGFVVTG